MGLGVLFALNPEACGPEQGMVLPSREEGNKEQVWRFWSTILQTWDLVSFVTVHPLLGDREKRNYRPLIDRIRSRRIFGMFLYNTCFANRDTEK